MTLLHPNVKYVSRQSQLIEQNFTGSKNPNIIVFPRFLNHDFDLLAADMRASYIEQSDLGRSHVYSLKNFKNKISPSHLPAFEALREDFNFLSAQGYRPEIFVVNENSIKPTAHYTNLQKVNSAQAAMRVMHKGQIVICYGDVALEVMPERNILERDLLKRSVTIKGFENLQAFNIASMVKMAVTPYFPAHDNAGPTPAKTGRLAPPAQRFIAEGPGIIISAAFIP